MDRGRRRRGPMARRLSDATLGFATVHALRLIRRFDPNVTANVGGSVLRTVGPWLPEHRVGRANLTAAFPEKSPDESEKIALRMRDDGKPALVFAAHLANWELAAVGPHAYGMDTTVLYRRPNVPTISDAVIAMRSGCMGTLMPT